MCLLPCGNNCVFILIEDMVIKNSRSSVEIFQPNTLYHLMYDYVKRNVHFLYRNFKKVLKCIFLGYKYKFY